MSLDTTTEQLVSNKPGVLSLAIKDKVALFTACMPYVKGGGEDVKKKIETVLGSALKSIRSTNAM